jgi:hypothetical protein
VDTAHTISALYNLVNVPSAVWIDELGRVRRIDEGTYATKHNLGGFEFGREDYAPMVANWAYNGEQSPYLRAPGELEIAAKTAEQAKAEPAFKLGLHFKQAGDANKAQRYLALAQTLNPDSWNYHRQDWAYTPEEAGRNWQEKVQTLEGKPYYKPIDGLDVGNSDGDL